MDYAPIKNTALHFATRNYQVKTTYTNGLQQRPLQLPKMFFTNAEYNTVGEEGKGWRLEPPIILWEVNVCRVIHATD